MYSDIETHPNKKEELQRSLTFTEQRLLLIRVYTILACQLGFTFGFCFVAFLWTPLSFIVSQPATVLVSIVSMFISLCMLQSHRYHSPWNVLLLILFTTSVSFDVSHIMLRVENQTLILSSIGVTMAIFATLTFTVHTSKKDYSFLGMWLLTSTLGFVLFSLVQMLVHSEWLNLLLSWFGTVLFSAYIVYDTSNLIHVYKPDESVEAAISLYLDIVNLFLLIMQVLQGSKD